MSQRVNLLIYVNSCLSKFTNFQDSGSHSTLPHFSRFTFDPTPHEAKLKPVHIRPYLKPAIREPTPLEQLHSLVSNQPAPLEQWHSLVSNQPAPFEQLISFIGIKSTSTPWTITPLNNYIHWYQTNQPPLNNYIHWYQINQPPFEHLYSFVSNQPAPLWTSTFIGIKWTSPPWTSTFIGIKSASPPWTITFIGIKSTSPPWTSTFLRIKSTSPPWTITFIGIRSRGIGNYARTRDTKYAGLGRVPNNRKGERCTQPDTQEGRRKVGSKDPYAYIYIYINNVIYI